MKRNTGLTIPLLTAVVLLIFLLFMTVFLKSVQNTSEPTLLWKLKMDYHLESSVLMFLQKYGNQQLISESDTIAREIAPGISLTVKGTRQSEQELSIEALIIGKDFRKRLNARVLRMALQNPTSSGQEQESGWNIRYLSQGDL